VDQAVNQVTVAASLAIHDRSLLKLNRLKATGKNWTQKHTSSIRHYGLTLQGAYFSYWCIKLKQQEEGDSVSPNNWKWPGCESIQVTHASMLTKSNVEHFIHWTNEVHRWGLGVHGQSCQKDVKVSVSKQNKDVRTSLGGDEYVDSDDEGDGEGDAEGDGKGAAGDVSL
jgi:hypothetical protein